MSDWYSEKKKKEIKETKTEGLVIGAAKYYAKVKKWDDRRTEALRNGEEFDEPMPTPQNVQESTPIEPTPKNINNSITIEEDLIDKWNPICND